MPRIRARLEAPRDVARHIQRRLVLLRFAIRRYYSWVDDTISVVWLYRRLISPLGRQDASLRREKPLQDSLLRRPHLRVSLEETLVGGRRHFAPPPRLTISSMPAGCFRAAAMILAPAEMLRCLDEISDWLIISEIPGALSILCALRKSCRHESILGIYIDDYAIFFRSINTLRPHTLLMFSRLKLLASRIFRSRF